MSTYTHRFWAEYMQEDADGVTREYALLHTFDNLTDARNAHVNARTGRWLTAGQHSGHLSGLHTYQKSNRLPEPHLPPYDIDGEPK